MSPPSWLVQILLPKETGNGEPISRKWFEALLKELTGTDWTVKLSLVEGLPSTSPSEEMPTQAERSKSRPNDSLDSFKNDPLIKEALEIFKGEIKSVTS